MSDGIRTRDRRDHNPEVIVSRAAPPPTLFLLGPNLVSTPQGRRRRNPPLIPQAWYGKRRGRRQHAVSMSNPIKTMLATVLAMFAVVPVNLIVFPHAAHAAAIPELHGNPDRVKYLHPLSSVNVPRHTTHVEVFWQGHRLNQKLDWHSKDCSTWRFENSHGRFLANWATCDHMVASFTYANLLVAQWVGH